MPQRKRKQLPMKKGANCLLPPRRKGVVFSPVKKGINCIFIWGGRELTSL